MRIFGAALLVSLTLAVAVPAQTKRAFPAGVPAKETGVEATGGLVAGRTYENKKFNFSLTVPEDWFFAGPDFEKVLKENGHDLSTDAIVHGGRNLDVLLTAFRSDKDRPGAVLRITAEDLRPYPQIRDAVDYFDAITAVYASVKLPPGFTYSSVKAEALGPRQFAFLDTSGSAGKKRMYGTVRGRWAIMLTLTYFDEADLQAVREMLTRAEFTGGSTKK